MSKQALTPLHIEWTPQFVRAINIATGQTAEAATIVGVSSITTGHRQVIVAVGRSSVFLKTLRLPKAATDDLRRIIEVQLGQIFPLPASALSFDFIQTADQNVEGLLTLVAAIRSEDLRAIREQLQQSGLTAERVLPVALGSVPVVTRADLATALVADGGSGGLGLDVVLNGVLCYSRMAGEGAAPADEVKRTLTAAQAAGAQVVAIGPVDLPDVHSSIHSPLSLLGEAPPFHFELSEDRINLTKQRVASRIRMAVLILLTTLLLAAFVWSDRVDALTETAKAQGKYAAWLVREKSIRSAETTKAAKAVSVQYALQRAFEPGQSLTDISSVVSDTLPAGAWLTGLTVERGKPLQIRGDAKTGDDIAHFVDALGGNARFRDVRLVFANSALIGKTSVVQFNVSATCVGNLPMPVPEKAAIRTGHSTANSTSPASTTSTTTGGAS